MNLPARFKFTATLTIAFFLIEATYAETLNLNNFVQKYLENSHNLAIFESTKKMSIESLSSIRTNYYPTLSLNGDYSKSNPLDDGFSDGATEGSLRLSQNLFNGLRDKNSIDTKKIEVNSAHFNLKQKKHEETIAAIDLYFSYLIQEKELKHLVDEVRASEDILKEVKRNFSFGNAKKSQVLSLESTIATLNIERSEAEVALKKILNSINVKLKSNFTSLSLSDVEFEKEYADPQLEAQLELEKRFDYRLSKLNIEKNQLAIDANQNSYLPTLDLAFTYKIYVNDYLKTRGTNVGDQGVVLSFSMPMPWSFDKNSKIASARYSYEIAQFENKKKIEDLEKEIQDLKLDLMHLSRQLGEIQKTLKISEESLQMIKKEFLSGLSSYTEYLNSFTANQKIIRQYDKIKLLLNQKIMETQLWSQEFEFN